MKSIRDAENLSGKKVILRADLNVPIKDGLVLEDTRIKMSLQTINFLKEKGTKVIIISHIEGKGGDSLKPVAKKLNSYIPIKFIESVIGEEVNKNILEMKDGDVILLENLRRESGEKDNDIEFAKKLASMGDIYVNDAFSVSHRKHASIVTLPTLLPNYAGFQLISEIEHISKVFNPPRPFLFILGGAKFDTKLPLINKFLSIADKVFVCGALSNNILKEKGFQTGKSLVAEGDFHLKDILENEKLVIPVDQIAADSGVDRICNTNDIRENEIVMDIGPKTLVITEKLINESKFVLWNGPTGNYELGYKDMTIEIAKALVNSNVHAAIGGGDTLAAIATLDLENQPDSANKDNIFISGGGGAMLQYLLDETLPGIEALN